MTGTQRTESARSSSGRRAPLSSAAIRSASAIIAAGSHSRSRCASRRTTWPAPTRTGVRGSTLMRGSTHTLTRARRRATRALLKPAQDCLRPRAAPDGRRRRSCRAHALVAVMHERNLPTAGLVRARTPGRRAARANGTIMAAARTASMARIAITAKATSRSRRASLCLAAGVVGRSYADMVPSGSECWDALSSAGGGGRIAALETRASAGNLANCGNSINEAGQMFRRLARAYARAQHVGREGGSRPPGGPRARTRGTGRREGGPRPPGGPRACARATPSRRIWPRATRGGGSNDSARRRLLDDANGRAEREPGG